MEKIVSLFMRNYETDRLIRDEIVPDAEWVAGGEGVATVKIDGTSCLIRDGVLYRRHDAKKGRTPPSGFIPAQDDPDVITGHWPGWLLVGDGPEDQWHRAAFANMTDCDPGTYELIGPKVQRNPYGLTIHKLIPHGLQICSDAPRTFVALRDYLTDHSRIEGLVWWRSTDQDCDKVKIKRRDFGLPWPPL